MFKTILIGTLILACASVAAAQSDDYKKWDFFAGFSHNRVDIGVSDNDLDLDDFIDEREGFNGFNTSVTRNVSRHLGFKFDVSGHYKTRSFNFATIQNGLTVKTQLYNFLGGAQLKDNSSEARFKPFAHALVGAGVSRIHIDLSNDVCIAIAPTPCPADNTETDTGLAGAIGGGLDIRAGDKLDIRVIQADYNPTRISGTTRHNFRFGVGLVFH